MSHQHAKLKQPRQEVKGNDRQSDFEGTLFFLHLSNQPPIVIKNIERILIRRGAQISQFFHNGVTYILTANNDANVDSISTFKAEMEFPRCTRSAQLLMESRKLHKVENTIDSSKIAQRLGIKTVTLSDIFSQSDLRLIRIPHDIAIEESEPNYKKRLVRNWLLQI